MDLANCSWGGCFAGMEAVADANLSLYRGVLEFGRGKPDFEASSEELSALASLLSFSGKAVRIPGTNLGLFLGDWLAFAEIAVVCGNGALLMLVCVFAAYYIRKAKSAWLTPAMRLTLLWSICVAIPLTPLVVLSVHGPFRSLLANFCMSSLGVAGFFRMLELITGTGPKGFDISAWNFALYFASPVEVAFDDEGRLAKAEPGCAKQCSRSLAGHVGVLLTCLSIGNHTNFMPFLDPDADLLSLPFFGLPAAIPAIYLQTVVLYCMLTISFLSGRAGLAFLGIGTHIGMRQPLLLSQSVRDFWGRRWNLLIHRLMHRIFFLPIKPKFGPQAAAIAAFVVSGLFHEYQWLASNFNNADYVPLGPSKFFLIQFVLTAGEAMLRGTSLGSLCGRVPQAARPLLVTVVCLPWGPYFLQGMKGSFQAAARLYPGITLLDA